MKRSAPVRVKYIFSKDRDFHGQKFKLVNDIDPQEYDESPQYLPRTGDHVILRSLGVCEVQRVKFDFDYNLVEILVEKIKEKRETDDEEN